MTRHPTSLKKASVSLVIVATGMLLAATHALTFQ